MNKYDAIFNEIQRRVDNGDITLEKAEQLNDMAYELYSEAFEGDLKINKLLGDCKTEYHNNIKDIKKAINDGNIDIAKRNIQSAKKNLIEASKIVDEIPTNAGDNVLGYLVETVNAFVKLTVADKLITGIVVGAMAVAAISTMFKGSEPKAKALPGPSNTLTDPFKGVGKPDLFAKKSLADRIDKKKLGTNASAALIGVALGTLIRYKKGGDANYYKRYAKKQLYKCMKHLDKLDKKLDKKAFKESCEYDESSSDDLFINQVFDCYLEEVITDDEFLSIMESYNKDI